MQRDDFMKHWDRLARNYNNHVKGLTGEQREGLADDYFDALKDFSDGHVFLAIKGHLEGERARYFPTIGQLIGMCRSAGGGSAQAQRRRWPIRPLPDNPTEHQTKVHEYEALYKDGFMSSRVLELTVVAGGPCMNREIAIKKALKEWDAQRNTLPCECPDNVKAIINNFTRRQNAEDQ